MSSTDSLARAGLGLLVAGTVAACGAATPGDDATVRSDLQALAQRRVFFGHQSVGGNVLDGLGRLSTRHGVTLRIVEAGPRDGVPPATFGHAFVAENGDPLQKLRSFRGAFESGAAAGADVALLKFCYVDFRADTDVAGLFAEYQATIAQLRARFPGTTFVHVSVPLTTVPGGVKATLKRLLGRPPPPEVLENARRDEYNALLRKAYLGREPVFDLARVEATRPDGGAESREWQGRTVPALVAAYSSDGGHLNEAGQSRAARELAAVLASAPRAGPLAPGRSD
jgi:hypothetical protein